MQGNSTFFLLMASGSLLLSSCSSPATFGSLEPGFCTQEQKILVTNHISGQIDALSEKNWSVAYDYAGKLFKTSIPLGQFETIINGQYRMLINNTGYKFDSCTIQELGITQRVSVTDALNKYLLEYTLLLEDQELGIDAASILSQTEQLNT